MIHWLIARPCGWNRFVWTENIMRLQRTILQMIIFPVQCNVCFDNYNTQLYHPIHSYSYIQSGTSHLYRSNSIYFHIHTSIHIFIYQQQPWKLATSSTMIQKFPNDLATEINIVGKRYLVWDSSSRCFQGKHIVQKHLGNRKYFCNTSLRIICTWVLLGPYHW